MSSPVRVVIASPPASAIGGIATHSRIVSSSLIGVRVFNEWWPLSDRSCVRGVRLTVHGMALARWVVLLAFGRVDIAHVQVSPPGAVRDITYARVARLLGKPVVAHLHSNFASDSALTPLRSLWPAVEAVIALDEQTAALVRAHQRRGGCDVDVYVLPNPVPKAYTAEPPAKSPPGPAEPVTKRPIVLLCPALLCQLKNQAGIVRAVDKCADAGLPVRVEFAGPWGDDLDVQARTHITQSNNTVLLGVLRGKQLLEAYDRADGLVLFSESEGEPLVVLEAMARALPVIASRVGAIPEVVPDERGNHLIAPGDEVALADAIKALAASAHDRHQAGQINRSRVLKTRSVEAHVSTLVDIYTRLTRRR